MQEVGYQGGPVVHQIYGYVGRGVAGQKTIFTDHLELLRAVEPKTSCAVLCRSLAAAEMLHFERVMEFTVTNCTSCLLKNRRRKIIQAVGSSLHLQKEPELLWREHVIGAGMASREKLSFECDIFFLDQRMRLS